MKIKCFSKRKLNVRISKTKIKCAILGFFPNCCIFGKSFKIPKKNLVKFSRNSAKFWQNLQHFVKNQQKIQQFLTKKLRLENGARLLGTLSKSLAPQEIRTKDIRFAVNSTKRNLSIVVVSQVYSQACHTALFLFAREGSTG